MNDEIQFKIWDRFFDSVTEMQEYVQSNQYHIDKSRELKSLARQEAHVGEQIKDLIARRVAVRKDIAEINCSFSVGQIIINKDGIRAQVERIGYSGHDSYHLIIRKMYKSGKLFNTFTKSWNRDKWVAYEPENETEQS